MNFRPDVAANRRPVLALRHLANVPLTSNKRLSKLQSTLALRHLADAPLTSNKRTWQRFRPVPKPSIPEVIYDFGGSALIRSPLAWKRRPARS